MTTVKRKTPTIETLPEQFRQHLSLKNAGAKLTAQAEKIKKSLKDLFEVNWDFENENGSKFIEFPETVVVDGVPYSGMENRRRVAESFDEDIATAILKKKKVYEKALTPVLDQDKVRLLQQEGKITAADLDKMFVESESWAFYPVKGEVDE